MQPKRTDSDANRPTNAAAPIRPAPGVSPVTPAGLAELQSGFDAAQFVRSASATPQAYAPQPAPASSVAATALVQPFVQPQAPAAAATPAKTLPPDATEPALLFVSLCARMVERRVELVGELATCTSPVQMGETLSRWTSSRIQEGMDDQRKLMEAMATQWQSAFGRFLPKRD